MHEFDGPSITSREERPTATVRRNIAANFIGRGATALLGVVFIPVYLRFLGIEAYGLVGFFATLHSLFGLLDLGLAATINRELARLSANHDNRQAQRDILRTLETCYWPLAIGTGALVFAMAPVLATRWIHPTHLPPASVERAIRLMGVVLALQIPFAFYQGALMGLQKHVLVNGVVVASATVRSVGTALVLWLVSSTVEAFFACQVAIGFAQTGAMVVMTWAALGAPSRGRVIPARLGSIWRYAAATSGNSVVAVGLAQLDKVLLSRLLPLDQFGYYALAGTVTAVIWAIAIPIDQALFPRFAQLFELGDRRALASLYHRGSQFMATALGPVAAVVALFSWQLIQLWTRDASTADHTYLIAALLITGTALNGLVSIPVNLQAAAGWPELIMYINVAGAILVVPTILVVVPYYGAVGGACVWLALNAAYVVLDVPLMHRRLLRGEGSRWYLRDVGLPLGAAVSTAAALRWAAPDAVSPFVTASYAAFAWLAAASAAAVAAPEIRTAIIERSKSQLKALFAG